MNDRNIKDRAGRSIDVRAAEDRYSELCASTNDRGRKTLSHVRTACRALIETSIPVTPSEVGRYCVQHFGGPKAGIISDEKDRLRSLVQFYQDAQTAILPQRAIPIRVITDEERLLRIPDHNIRAWVGDLIAERNELAGHVGRLRKAFKRSTISGVMTPADAYGPISEEAPISTQIVVEAGISVFSEAERTAAAHFLSDEFLVKEGLVIEESLGIKTRGGRFYAKWALVTALRKIAG